MQIQNDEEMLLTTIDIAHTSVAALSRVVEHQTQLIHQLTAPRPSRLPETLQALTAFAPLIQAMFATPKLGDAERRARAEFDVKYAELVRDRAERITTARAADEAKVSRAKAA